MRIDRDCPLEVGDRVRRTLPAGRGEQYGHIVAIEGGQIRVALADTSGGGEVECPKNQLAYEPLPSTIRARSRAVRRRWADMPDPPNSL